MTLLQAQNIHSDSFSIRLLATKLGGRWDCDVEKFGEILRTRVKGSGLSQRQFAEKAGMTQGTLSRLMKKSTLKGVRPSTLQGIAAAVGMEASAFMSEISQEKEPATVQTGESTMLEMETLPKFVSWFKGLPKKDRAAVYKMLGEYVGGVQNATPGRAARTTGRAG